MNPKNMHHLPILYQNNFLVLKPHIPPPHTTTKHPYTLKSCMNTLDSSFSSQN